MSASDNCRVYIGNLPEDVRKEEIVELLSKYGRVRDVEIKLGRARYGTAYAFAEFDHPRDAEEAVERADRMSFGGHRLRVEFTGQRKPRRSAGSGPPVRSDFRVIVLGLPRQVSWQDLKDHMRAAGNVGYATIDADKRGIVEYESERGQFRALEMLHKSEFRNPFGRSVIRVYREEDLDHHGRSPGGGSGSESSSDGRDYERKRRRSQDDRRRAPKDAKRPRYGDDGLSPEGPRDASPRSWDRRDPSPRRDARRRDLSPRRDRRDAGSPRSGRDVSPRPRDLSPRARDLSPRGRDLSPRARDLSPRARDLSPRGRDLSPRGRDSSPRGRDSSPRGRDVSPRGRDSSPRGRDLSPRGRDVSPRGRDVSPRGRDSSPRGSSAERGRSPSPKRDSSPREKQRDSSERREESPGRKASDESPVDEKKNEQST